jgi:hypothetical protein
VIEIEIAAVMIDPHLVNAKFVHDLLHRCLPVVVVTEEAVEVMEEEEMTEATIIRNLIINHTRQLFM